MRLSKTITYGDKPVQARVYMSFDASNLLRKMITCPQIRAARALLNWTAVDLNQVSGVSGSAILRAEQAPGLPDMKAPNLFKLQRALETDGAVFLAGDATLGAGAGCASHDGGTARGADRCIRGARPLPTSKDRMRW